MTGGKLLKLVQALNDKEQKNISKHLTNKSLYKEELFLLWKLILAQEEQNKEQLFKHIYPKKLYNDTLLRKLFSDLYKALKGIIFFISNEADELKINQSNIRYFDQKKASDVKLMLQQELHRTLEQLTIKDAAWYYNHYLFELNALDEQMQIKRFDNMEGFVRVSNYLNKFYLLEHLKMILKKESMNQIYKKNYSFEFEETILEASKQSQDALIRTFYLTIQLLKTGEPNTYSEIEQFFNSNSGQYHQKDLRDILLVLINYCITQVNKGNFASNEALFTLYKKGVDDAILLDNGCISIYTYSNTMAIGLKLGYFEAVYQLIDLWKSLLEEHQQEQIYAYNLSRYYYHIKDYKKATQIILKNEYKDKLLNASSKLILLKIYYETENYDLLTYHLINFRMYLRRLKFIGYQKEVYMNIIKLTEKLLNLDVYNKKQVEHYQNLIAETQPNTEKEWFLKQLKSNH